MVMKAVVNDLEEIDEALRSEYKETTDTKTKEKVYVLDVEGHDSHPALKKVKEEAGANRIALKTANTKLEAFKAFDGLDPIKVRADLDRIPDLEAAAEGKVDAAKLDEMANKKAKILMAPVERERDTLKKENGDLLTENGNLKGEKKQSTIKDAVRTAALKLKIRDTALEDVEIIGGRLFDVAEDGGVFNKDGESVEIWLKDQQAKRPHWWGDTIGAGSRGSGGAGGAGSNPWSFENWNMTQQGVEFKKNPKMAEQMALKAGTTIGGQKPAKK